LACSWAKAKRFYLLMHADRIRLAHNSGWPQVVAHSPGAQAGLAPFFDFIVAANGQVLVEYPQKCFRRLPARCSRAQCAVPHTAQQDREDSRLVDALRSNLEHEVDLSVYSTKTEQVRSAFFSFLALGRAYRATITHCDRVVHLIRSETDSKPSVGR
jgi:hypothetical protein